MNNAKNNEPAIFLYGPPGAGKTTLGRALAEALGLPFCDLDGEIERQQGRQIAAIFAAEGETAFRRLESQALSEAAGRGAGVVALGGGALLDPENRRTAELAGVVLCLAAERQALLDRTEPQSGTRPLLAGQDPAARLESLLAARAEHYASFPLRLDTTSLSVPQALEQAQVLLGAFRIRGMGQAYDVRIRPGGLDRLGAMLRQRSLNGPVALVCDRNVAALYAARVGESLRAAGYSVWDAVIPAGEEHKNMDTVLGLCERFLAGGLERGSTVVALGGGVTTDLAGFAASIYLRGVRWVAVPTTLLGMMDASLGGKTGADLPQGKNLVGAFHPPALVLADPGCLATLPEGEVRSGLGEALKQAILGDPALFARLEQGWGGLQPADWDEVVRRGMAVKVRYIEADPYEQGVRAALNLGHTIGHAVEHESGYTIRHGEAVAIGLVEETRLAEQLGTAEAGLAGRIAAACTALGLPGCIPEGMDREKLKRWMAADKKKAGGLVRFVLPVRIGEVQTGVAVELEKIWMAEGK